MSIFGHVCEFPVFKLSRILEIEKLIVNLRIHD